MNEFERNEEPVLTQVANDNAAAAMNNQGIKMGSMVDKNIKCAGCNSIVSTANAYCYAGRTGNDVYYCESCKKLIDQSLESQTKHPNILGAIIVGLLAGIVSGAIWCGIAYFTGYTVGYVAIGVGFLIAQGVMLGAGRKRGFALQLISAVLTLFTIISATYMTYMLSINDYIRTSKEYAAYYHHFIWLSPFDSDIISYMISPMGLLIWGIGIAAAFRIPASKN
jgi:hypothetical protein